MSSALLVEPLVGVQEPRVLSLPPGLPDQPGDFGDRAVRLADLAGLQLDPWQKFALRAMLRRTGDGHFAAFESCILVPRQNGKSVLLEAFDLAKLFLSDPGANGHLILHTAHLFPTAMESYRHLTGLVRNTPELWDEVERVSKAHGEEGLELKNGNRLRFAARTVTGAGRGFSPDDVVWDEAFRLPHEAMSAMRPSVSAKPDPQMVYASSTGYPDSEILWSLVERGRTGTDESLAFLEWSADPTLDLTDPEQLWLGVAQGNPSLGLGTRHSLTERKIAAEMAGQRIEDRDRERLGLWADTNRKGPFGPGVWEKLEDPESSIRGPVTFAVEVSEDRSWSSIAGFGDCADWMHGEVIDYRPDAQWVGRRIAELAGRHVSAAVIIRPGSPAGALIQDLEDRGVRVIKASAQEYAQACGMVYDAVVAGQIRHLSQPELNMSVRHAQRKPAGDAWRWDPRGSIDITPWIAFTMALWGHKVHGANDITEAVW